MFKVQWLRLSTFNVQGRDGSLNLEPGTLNRAHVATLNFEPRIARSKTLADGFQCLCRVGLIRAQHEDLAEFELRIPDSAELRIGLAEREP